MNKAIGLVCVCLSGLLLIWTVVATFVVPGRMKQAEQMGRELPALEQLLFSASMATANVWFVAVGVAALGAVLGVVLLSQGSPGDASEPS